MIFMIKNNEPKNPKEYLYSKMLKEYFSCGDRKFYTKKVRQKLVNDFGGCCEICKTIYRLEFAHMNNTTVEGTGRGIILRLADITLNKCLFKLLCKRCHAVFDILCLHCNVSKDVVFLKTKKLINLEPNIKHSSLLSFDGDKFVLKSKYVIQCL